MLHADCSTRTESTTGSTAFTLCCSDLHDSSAVFSNDHGECGVRALVGTHSTTCTKFWDALCVVRLKFDLSCVDWDGCCGCCTFCLCDSVWNVFWTLTDTSEVDTGGGGSTWVKLRVCFKEPLVCGAGYTEVSADRFGLCSRLDCSG